MHAMGFRAHIAHRHQRSAISSHPNALTVTRSPVSTSTVVVSASMMAGPVRVWPGLQVVERIDRNFAPAAEKGLPLAAWRTGAWTPRPPRALVLPRDFADGGDAGVDEHDFLAARGVGVEFFMPDVKAVLDPVDEIGGVPVEAVERDVDLKDLLAVAHLGGALDRDLSVEP